MKQVFNRFLKKFEVNNYNPFSIFNTVLALITLMGGGILYLLFDNFGFSGAFELRGSDRTFLMVSLIATPISFIFLMIRNLKIKNVPKIILYTILQLVFAIIMAIIFLIVFFIGSLLGGSTTSTTLKTYSNEEDQYAKANGYFDAASANEKGFDTSVANNPGFDYTEKKN